MLVAVVEIVGVVSVVVWLELSVSDRLVLERMAWSGLAPSNNSRSGLSTPCMPPIVPHPPNDREHPDPNYSAVS